MTGQIENSLTHAQIRAMLQQMQKPAHEADTDLMQRKMPAETIFQQPVELYTSEEHCQRERDRLFRDFPLVLEHQGRIPPGHSLAVDAAGIPLLITNETVEGEPKIRVFLNQCRHRSTRILPTGSTCEGQHLTCPYHNWSYRLNGDLHSLPHAEGFPGLNKADHGLIEVPSAVRGGLVFAIPKPGAELDIDPWLGDISQYLDEMETADDSFFKHSSREWACNWKLPSDAFLEAYHIHRLHKETLGPLFTDNLAHMRWLGNHLAAAVPRSDIQTAYDQSEAAWDVRNLVTFSLYLLPNTVLIYHPDYTSVVRFFPINAGRCRIDHSMLVNKAPETDAEIAHWERAFDMTDRRSFGEEDFHICQEMQAGMAAGGQKNLLVGSYESGIRRYHELLRRLLESCASHSG